MDCTTFQVSNIRPLPGDILVEILKPDQSPGGILFSERVQAGALGSVSRADEKKPSQEALVRKLGPVKKGEPFECGLGDRVLIGAYSGRKINRPPRAFRLVKASEILAVFV